jgi:hypothetical protein
MKEIEKLQQENKTLKESLNKKDKQIKDLFQVITIMTTALKTVEAIKEGDMRKAAEEAIEGAERIKMKVEAFRKYPTPVFKDGKMLF